MDLMLGYKDKRGGHTTMSIKPEAVEDKLKYLAKRRFEAVVWDANNRTYEVGWAWKHEESGWTWCFDTDIFN